MSVWGGGGVEYSAESWFASLLNMSRDSRKSTVEYSAVMPSPSVIVLLHSLGRYLLAMFDLSIAVP